MIIHGTFISVNVKYLLIQNSVLHLTVLILSLFYVLLINNIIEFNDYKIFNNTITVDYLSFFSKAWIAVISILCFIITQYYITRQKINYFEYSVLILFALLGIFFICSYIEYAFVITLYMKLFSVSSIPVPLLPVLLTLIMLLPIFYDL